ncbi:hypothetical protein O988_07998 [Pseudogymnoascus sp. VKM F-3808]|nr:hypothetical protein O988_07998 [Pseudogymnoascus sp. VKM F-3808]
MEDDFMMGKKPLVKRHVKKSEIRRVQFHPPQAPQTEPETSDNSTVTGSKQDQYGFKNDSDEGIEDRTIKQIIALGCDASVSKKVVTDTLDRIEGLGKHPDQPGRTARVEIFYFISHVMQTHSRQLLAQQASNPFKNPRHMAAITTRLMEIYLAANPAIRFLIITYPMHHLSLMLALRDHIGPEVFKVVTIVPAAPFGPRTSSLTLGLEGESTPGKDATPKDQASKASPTMSNPYLTPHPPTTDLGKPDFVLYTTSPLDTIERVPIRIDLLIQEIEEYVNPSEDPTPVMAPRPAVAWDTAPTGLPHPLTNTTRTAHYTSLSPLNLKVAAKLKTSTLMAKYHTLRRKRYPNAAPRTAEMVNAQWEYTYKNVYNAFRKIKLVKERAEMGRSSLNPSDDEKADDEGDDDSSEDEVDDSSRSSESITPTKANTSFTATVNENENPFNSDAETHYGSPVPAAHHPIHSDEELNSAVARSPPESPVRRRVSFSPLSVSYSFEARSSSRSSGFWSYYVGDDA